MDWNSHITNISNKITKTMGIMNRIKKSIPQQILNLMYNSLILPHIYFCITAWGFKCNRIFTLQKKALRIITKSKFNSHTEPLFRELSILKVEHIFQMQCLKLYYNVINERTPDFFSKMFKLKSRMHSHETRQKNYIHIAGTRTTSAKQCIRQYIPTVLTSIPTLVSDKITTHSNMLVSQDTQSNISFNFINMSVSSRIVIYVLMLRNMEQPVTFCVV